jgi:hypothetical protein
MNSQPRNTETNPISMDELRAIAGTLDDEKVIDILNLQPTPAELEQAVIWASGDGDLLAQGGHPMTGKVAEIVEILTADEDEPPPVR